MVRKISLKVKKSEIAENLILFAILFQVLFANFLGLEALFNKLIAGAILIKLVFMLIQKRREYSKGLLLSFAVVIVWLGVAVVSAMYHKSFRYFSDNILSLTYAITIVGFGGYMMSEKRRKFEAFFVRLCPLLFIYTLINTIIIFIQAQGTYFLIDLSRTTNHFYVDHICGFQGLSGVNRLIMLWTFIAVYNFWYARNYAVKKRRYYWYSYLFLGITLLQSIQNDGKFYFVFLIYMIAVYVILVGYLRNRLTNKMFALSFVGLLGWIIASTFGEAFLESLGEAGEIFAGAIDQVLNVDFSDSSKNNERISVLIYTFANGNFWGFGRGIGEYSFFSSETAHGLGTNQNGGYWGTANLGPFLYAFGFYVTLFLNIITSSLFTDWISKSRKTEVFPFLMVFTAFILLMFYNKVYTLQSFMANFVMTMAVLGFERDAIMERTATL